jgi:hypothetical protein
MLRPRLVSDHPVYLGAVTKNVQTTGTAIFQLDRNGHTGVL